MQDSTARVIVLENETKNNVVNLFEDQKPTKIPKAKRVNIPHRAEYIRSLDDIKAIQNFYLTNFRYRDYMMFTVGICTGFRISDLTSLNISDVLNEDGSFKEYIDITEKKTGKRSSNPDDKCIITEAMKIAIATYLRHHKVRDYNEPLMYSRKPDCNGEHRIKEESGWRIIKQAQRALGLTYNLGSHSMRKTFANIAACCGRESNIDMNKLLQIQHMLKHSDYKTTMRYLNLNSIFTSRARTDVSDFVLGKTQYNDLTEALMGGNDSSDNKLDRIIELLDELTNLTEE